MDSTVSSPMLEILKVFPLIFPYPPSMEIFFSSRKVLTNPATSISRLLLTQVNDLDANSFWGRSSNPLPTH